MSGIPRLLKELKGLIKSEENHRRMAALEQLNRKEPVVTFNGWCLTRGFPGAILPWFGRLGVTFDLECVARETGPVTPDFAAQMIEFQLRQKIWKFQDTPDDTPISPVINSNLALSWLYRPGPFGERFDVVAETGAYVVSPVILEESDLDSIEFPRYAFDRALHEARLTVYNEILGGELVVYDDGLPAKIYAPFGVANNLRGGLELLMDVKERPEFVHRLMRRITEATLGYNAKARDFEAAMWPKTGVGVLPEDHIVPWEFSRGGVYMTLLGSDEVSCDMFAPEEYEEFIFPYEREVAATCDHIYYHSCGNLTPLFEKIVQLPNLHRLHVSPWSDMRTAVEAAAGKVIIEKWLDPKVNLDLLSPEAMLESVKKITDLGGGYALEMIVPVQTAGGWRFREMFNEEIGR